MWRCAPHLLVHHHHQQSSLSSSSQSFDWWRLNIKKNGKRKLYCHSKREAENGPRVYTPCVCFTFKHIYTSQRSQRQRERYIALSPFARRSFSLAVVVVYFVCCAFHLKKIKLWSKRKSSNFVCREKYKTNIIFTVLSLSIDKTHLIKFIIWYLLFYTSTKHTN